MRLTVMITIAISLKMKTGLAQLAFSGIVVLFGALAVCLTRGKDLHFTVCLTVAVGAPLLTLVGHK